MNQHVMTRTNNLPLVLRVQMLLVGLALLVGACAEPGAMEQRPPPAESEAVLPDYVGLSESQARDVAQRRDTPFRVVTRDGVRQIVTFDFIRGRINADIRDGMVVAYAVEGTKQQTKKSPSAEKTSN